MYYLVFMRDITKEGSILSKHSTIESAAAARAVSGDLVTDQTGKVVNDERWLFDWEKTRSDSYARKHQCAETQIKLRKH